MPRLLICLRPRALVLVGPVVDRVASRAPDILCALRVLEVRVAVAALLKDPVTPVLVSDDYQWPTSNFV